MVNAKGVYQSSGRFLVIIYLILFPFGQLLRFGFSTNYGNLQDVIVLFSLIYYFLPITRLPKIDKYVRFSVFASLFSLVLSLNSVSLVNLLYGALYLLRIISYYTFGVLVFNLIRLKAFSPTYLLNLLIAVGAVSAIFGWLQYLAFPDLVFLKYIGWDDHLYRLVGTFLDPGFTGLILVLGSLISLFLYSFSLKKIYLLSFIFLLISTLFTYSRASYLSLVVGLLSLVYFERYIRKIALASLVLFSLVLLLIPKTEGEGVKLLRTASVNARISNYSQTIELIKESPLFGVGLNNLCAYRVNRFNENPSSHSCSGVDSSILFITSTTGIVGLMIFIFTIYQPIYFVPAKFRTLLIMVYSSLFVHSLFVQSLFYSFVMGYVAIFFGSVGKFKEHS